MQVSMKKIIIYVVILLCLLGAYFYFASDKTLLVKNGTASSSLADLVVPTSTINALNSQPRTVTGGMVSIDFDDGWQDQYDNALPILESENVTATFFIITGTLIPGKYQGYMTAREVSDIYAKGQAIGAHTITHPYLTQIPAPEAKKQMLDSKHDLENLLSTTITNFAYPYGDENNEVAAIAHAVGFESARTSTHGTNDGTQNPYFLNAVAVDQDISLAEIKGMVDNAQKTGTWLILAFHQIEENNTDLDPNGEAYATSPQLLKEIIDYIKAKNVPIVTEEEGLKKI